MFILSTFQDTIRVPASQLGKPIEDELTDILNARLANKVVHNVGLVICLKDIVDVGESYLHDGDGAIFTKCTFRMIVFRPQVGEVICGTLRSSSREGLKVSLDFFDSIVIPPKLLNETSRFDESDQSWTWYYDDEGKTHSLKLEIGEKIRFRVYGEEFVDIPIDLSHQNTSKQANAYTITGSICESGLGLIKWWS